MVAAVPERRGPGGLRRRQAQAGQDEDQDRGISDEQVVEYTWSEDVVRWTLVSASQLKAQDASYTLTPDGEKTKVRFDISIDLAIPLPGFVLKRAMKGGVETATDGLRKQVLKVKKGN